MIGFNKTSMIGSVATRTRAEMTAMSSFGTTGSDLGTEFSSNILEGLVNTDSDKELYDLYREIYMMDTVCGPAVDIMSSLPWSDCSLMGVDDTKQLQYYEDTLDELGLISTMGALSTSYLVLGKIIGSLLFDSNRGIFTDIITHNPDDCEITPIPLRGYDPKIDLKISTDFKKFLASKDPRDIEARKEINPQLMQKLKSGKIELEPLSTLYLQRTLIPGIESMSYYTRVLPIWLIEKALMRGTIIGAWRRQRSILHIMAGNEDWLPSDEQLSMLTQLFQNADRDPQGAVVTTRDGVQAQELRQGNDFWKVSDEWDIFANAKMRALGINEAFLSGEACLVGNSLIPTSEGLKYIGKLGSREQRDGKLHDLNLTVDSRYGHSPTAKWMYSGYRPTFKVKTALGNHIQCTENHPLLVMTEDGNHIWKRTDSLQIGDVLCVSTRKTVRTSKLELQLTPYVPKPHTAQCKSCKIPTEMTTDLAFLLGLFISEGHVNGYNVWFSNTNKSLLNRWKSCMKSVFGLTCNEYISSNKGEVFEIQGVVTQTNKTCYSLQTGSAALLDYLHQLGCYVGGNKNNKTASHYKRVPWAILEADEQSQLAFLAAYLEGDGCIYGMRYTFISSSRRLLRELLAIVNAHGYLATKYENRLQLLREDTLRLRQELLPYLVTKKGEHVKGLKARNRFGFSVKPTLDLLKRRNQGFDRNGITFLNDEGEPIKIRGFAGNIIHGAKRFLYDAYDRGYYTEFLDQLKVISKKEYDRVTQAFKTKFYYTPVVEISKCGKRHVYDVSMAEGVEPAFVANGLVVHNTYSNAEVALSVFMENIRSFRETMTSAILYDKIFLLLAKYHGFKTRTQAEITNRVRLTDSERNRDPYGKKKRLGMYASRNLAEAAQYNIPTVHWSKELKATGDTSVLDLLKQAQEFNIPIPLAMIATACGVSLTSVIDSFDEDKEQRKKIKAHMDELKKDGLDFKSDGESSMGMFGSTEVVAASTSSGSPKFDSTLCSLVTGMPRDVILDKKKAQKILNYAMALSKQSKGVQLQRPIF